MMRWPPLRLMLAGIVIGFAGIAAGAQENTPSPTAYLSPTPTYFAPGSIVLTPTPTPGPDSTVLDDLVAARWTATTYAPLSGEPFTLTLTVTLPPAFALTEWPDLPAGPLLPWGDLVVLARDERVEERAPDGATTHRQSLTALIWRPGDFETPITYVGYSDRVNQLRIPAREAFISVPTVLIPGDETLRPLRPTVDLPYLSPVWALAGVAVLGGVIMGVRYRRQRMSAPPPPAAIAPPTPFEIARAELAGLAGTRALGDAARTARVRAALRAYLVAGGRMAGGETTAEIDEALRAGAAYPDALLDELRALFEALDALTYAEHAPDPAEVERLIARARRWLAAGEPGDERPDEAGEGANHERGEA